MKKLRYLGRVDGKESAGIYDTEAQVDFEVDGEFVEVEDEIAERLLTNPDHKFESERAPRG